MNDRNSHAVHPPKRTFALLAATLLVLTAAACAPSTPASGSTATIDVGGQTVTVAGPAGSTVTVGPADLGPLPAVPANLLLPVGALDIDVDGVASGSVARVTVRLQQPVDSVLKLIDGAWDPFAPDGTTGATLSGDGLTITLLLQDGGRGDTDDAANGRIADPMGPAVQAELEWMPKACYDSPNPNIADFYYDGPVNTLSNFRVFRGPGNLPSMDGTCTGNPETQSAAIVRAADLTEAAQVCHGLGLAQVYSPANMVSLYGFVGVPDDAWIC